MSDVSDLGDLPKLCAIVAQLIVGRTVYVLGKDANKLSARAHGMRHAGHFVHPLFKGEAMSLLSALRSWLVPAVSRRHVMWSERVDWIMAIESLEGRQLLSNVTVTFAVSSDWGSGFGANVTISNQGAAPIAVLSCGARFKDAQPKVRALPICELNGGGYLAPYFPPALFAICQSMLS